jgi:hypothetical protein
MTYAAIRKKIILFVFVFSTGFSALYAQMFLEGGLLIGGSNYIGDLSGTFMNLGLTRPSGGIMVRYNLSEHFSAKGYMGYGRIVGADSLSGNTFEQTRNLSFFTDLYEISLQMEYNFLPYSYKYYDKKQFVPYVFLGVGLFNYNPKTNFRGNIIELQPLGTEGQGTTEYNDREKYALTQFCFPFGAGVKKRVAERWTVGFELGFRYTMTNYLDDVGGTYANFRVVQRGNGLAAGILSDRSDEKNLQFGPDNELIYAPKFNEGDRRSNKKYDLNDFYVFAGLNVTFRFRKNVVCPKM